MLRSPDSTARGLALLVDAVREVLDQAYSPTPLLAGAAGPHPGPATGPLWSTLHGEAPGHVPLPRPGGGPTEAGRGGHRADGRDAPVDHDPESLRLAALVDLARSGDVDAFGLLFDHYQPIVYRFLRHRTSSDAIAEDLTSETFFRALRGLSAFRWQGRDFGAWLTTIARNLLLDHAKAARTRLERTSDDPSVFESATDGPEHQVLAAVTEDLVRQALTRLAPEQRECLMLRFVEGCSIAETAAVLRRSEGAVKQLQLRAVRKLAAMMPEGIR